MLNTENELESIYPVNNIFQENVSLMVISEGSPREYTTFPLNENVCKQTAFTLGK